MGAKGWLRAVVRRRLDRRYAHGSQVRALEAKFSALSAEVNAIRHALAKLLPEESTPSADRSRLNDAHRLATETARAVERLLQAEVELWQAVDAHERRGVHAARVDV